MFTPDRQINPDSFYERWEDAKEEDHCTKCQEKIEEDQLKFCKENHNGKVCEWCLNNKEHY
jgi:hypothetical protein